VYLAVNGSIVTERAVYNYQAKFSEALIVCLSAVRPDLERDKQLKLYQVIYLYVSGLPSYLTMSIYYDLTRSREHGTDNVDPWGITCDNLRALDKLRKRAVNAIKALYPYPSQSVGTFSKQAILQQALAATDLTKRYIAVFQAVVREIRNEIKQLRIITEPLRQSEGGFSSGRHDDFVRQAGQNSSSSSKACNVAVYNVDSIRPYRIPAYF
jgi:hypothetical protein